MKKQTPEYHRYWVYKTYGFDVLDIPHYEKHFTVDPTLKDVPPGTVDLTPMSYWAGLFPFTVWLTVGALTKTPALIAFSLIFLPFLYIPWAKGRDQALAEFIVSLRNYRKHKAYYEKFWADKVEKH